MSATDDPEISEAAKQALQMQLPGRVDLKQVKQITAQTKTQIAHCKDKAEGILHDQISQSQYTLELLAQSCDDISSISDGMETVRDEKDKIDSLLPSSEFSQIRQVTPAQIVGSIPQRGEALIQRIQNDTLKEKTTIRKNYKELRALHKLRQRAQRHLDRLKRSENISDEMLIQIREVEDQLKVVDTAGKMIEKKLRQLVHFFLHYADSAPHILIDALLVCELEDKTPDDRVLKASIMEWRLWREQDKANDDDDLEDVDAEPSSDSMQKKVLFEICERIQEVVRDDLKDDIDFHEFLKNAENILNDIEFITNSLGDVFPPEYDIVSFCIQRYLSYTVPKIASRIDPNVIQPGEVLDALAWVETKFNPTMRPMRNVLGGINRQKVENSLEHFKHASSELTRYFLDANANRMKSFVDNMIKHEMEKKFHFAAKQPYTHTPQDLMDLLDNQFTIAVTRLSGSIFVDFVLVILRIVEYYTSQVKELLEAQHLELKDIFLCAWVNNAYRLSEMISERMTMIFEAENKNSIQFADRERLDEAFDAQTCAFTKLSIRAIELLVQKIMSTTIEPRICPEFFTTAWSNGDTHPMQNVAATFEDYYADVSTWFDQPYYCVVFISSFTKVFIHSYCEALANTAIDARKFHMKKDNGLRMIGERIMADAKILEQVLLKPEVHQQFREESLKAELKIFKSLSNLFTAPEDVLHCYVPRFSKSCPSDLVEKLFHSFLKTRRLKKEAKNKLLTKLLNVAEYTIESK